MEQSINKARMGLCVIMTPQGGAVDCMDVTQDGRGDQNPRDQQMKRKRCFFDRADFSSEEEVTQQKEETETKPGKGDR